LTPLDTNGVKRCYR